MTGSAHPTVVVYADSDSVAEATGARLLIATGDAVALRGRADIVLTGGTVGIELLRKAAASPLAFGVDWTSVHVWWGDERFVHAGSPERNEGQAQQALLGALPVPEENIHRMGSSTDFDSPESAAEHYSAVLAAHAHPQWDVALFGMGPDGHVASLFPDHPVYVASLHGDGSDPHNALPVHDSPKPPALRVTLSLAAINRAREVWIVAAGAEKAPAVAQALRSDSLLPAAQVRGTARTLWLLDAAAATRI